jgi:putative membrane protein
MTTLAMTVLCIGALGACKQTDRTAMDTAAARTDSAAGRIDSAAGAKVDSTGAMATSSSAWTNDRIFGFAHNANEGEIALGKLASTKATNPQVKAFGKEMVKDHTAMMAGDHALFTKLGAKPDSLADDAKELRKSANDELNELTAKAAGTDWDKQYIDDQVETHQKVLDKLNDIAKSSTDSTLTKGLAKDAAMVQEHLTKAQNIKNTQFK